MQLGRYQVSTLRPSPILSISFSPDGRFFAVATEKGYEVWKSFPLSLVRRRPLPGTLALALPLPDEPLLVLQGGGAAPLFPPNKAVIFHDVLGVSLAELEFGERIRGVACRRGMIVIALLRRVIAFTYTLTPNTAAADTSSSQIPSKASMMRLNVQKHSEWATYPNPTGLLAISTTPRSTLLALPGRQPGHVQLIQLPSCPAAPSSSSPSTSAATQPGSGLYRNPIILAHTHPLSTLACSADGKLLITTSERGTLLRVWETGRGRLEKELRRGVDPAGMWGTVFEEQHETGGGRVVGWSDKGTVHVWGEAPPLDGTSRPVTPTTNPPQSLTHLLSRNLPLPKYFSSEISSAQYHLPRKNPHAFAGVAVKAGVPSIKLEEQGREAEEAERFVVGWVDVPVVMTQAAKELADVKGKGKAKMGMGMGMGMGTREERQSFGSEGTSRTATPTLSAPSRRHGKVRTVAPSAEGVKPPQEATAGRKRVERQLVAITYAGDWYRLRIPDERDVDEEEGEGDGRKRKGKCELVEYRRLGVGGGGW